ncbi:hypothetical protein [Sorangium sp. So ce1099]|uniref:hypothetical protein n=1 Tax=Sorangium sp. So ce1099 TaxID=3133331 RepID=UPI003F628BB4
MSLIRNRPSCLDEAALTLTDDEPNADSVKKRQKRLRDAKDDSELKRLATRRDVGG